MRPLQEGRRFLGPQAGKIGDEKTPRSERLDTDAFHAGKLTIPREQARFASVNHSPGTLAFSSPSTYRSMNASVACMARSRLSLREKPCPSFCSTR